MTDLDQTCINTLRLLACDTISKAKSGHPGAPLGLAPTAHILWTKFMNYQQNWINRDRFVLSCGHASALYYSLLHLHSNIVTIEDLKNFRQYQSKTPGHPERHMLSAVEVTTGPLGQGISSAVGLALTELHLAARFNKPKFELFNHKVFCFASDGDMMEGVQSEAASFAGHQKLNNLICFWDNNHITISGNTDISFSENVPLRYQAYGWHTITVEDANEDYSAIEKAIEEAIINNSNKPVLIELRTTIGYGSDLADSSKIHGSPLTNEQLASFKKKLGFDANQSFYVPDEVYDYYERVRKATADKVSDWNSLYREYSSAYPSEYEELEKCINGNFTYEYFKSFFTLDHKSSIATRQSSGNVLNQIVKNIPGLIGGSADLATSNGTDLRSEKTFTEFSRGGRQIEFGVREHGMQAIANGISYYGLKGIVPFTATFFVFIQYLMPSLRCACLESLRTILVMTHDSIGVGEDGSTHQPVETLAQCRSLPNISVFRPCDQLEVFSAYASAFCGPSRPTVIVLSRQNAQICSGADYEGALKGGYIIKKQQNGEPGTDFKPKLVIIGTGTEVYLAIKAAEQCPFDVQVVSLPCQEIFLEQSESYRREVIPKNTPVLSVEAANSYGWERFSHYHMGVDRFGISCPAKKAYEHFGLTVEDIVDKSKRLVKYYETRPIPELIEKPDF